MDQELGWIKRVCPLCGPDTTSIEFKPSNFDSKNLSPLSWASRKPPEYMSHRYELCNSCEILYATPVPDTSNLSENYAEAEYDSTADSKYAAQTYISHLTKLIPNYDRVFPAIDIGAGDGALVHELRRNGWGNVIGIEPSTAPLSAASPEIRDLLIHDIFRPEQWVGNGCGLITICQTIEHLDDPLGMVKGALQALRPGGRLVIIAHNRDSFVNQLLGFFSPIYDIEHLQIYSPASIKRLLAQAGAVKVTTSSITNTYPLSYWVRLAPLPQRLKKWAENNHFCRSTMITLPVGNMLAVGHAPQERGRL